MSTANINVAMSSAISGLSANQVALSTTSNNIANANTVGYTQKRVNPETVKLDGQGAGVELEAVFGGSDGVQGGKGVVEGGALGVVEARKDPGSPPEQGDAGDDGRDAPLQVFLVVVVSEVGGVGRRGASLPLCADAALRRASQQGQRRQRHPAHHAHGQQAVEQGGEVGAVG